MRGMQGTRGMSTGIPGILLQDSGECSHYSLPGNAQDYERLLKIPRNVPEDSGECYQRFRGIFGKIPGNVVKDSGEFSRGFRGIFRKIPGNAFNFKLIKATF